jgi:hypothetical protein
LCPGIDTLEDLGDMMMSEKQNGLGLNACENGGNINIRVLIHNADPSTFVYNVKVLTINTAKFVCGMCGKKYAS